MINKNVFVKQCWPRGNELTESMTVLVHNKGQSEGRNIIDLRVIEKGFNRRECMPNEVSSSYGCESIYRISGYFGVGEILADLL